MDTRTIHYLNAINRRFYETVAADFDESRQGAWQGWERIVRRVTPPLRVLDVGCGNGRFGVYLCERFGADGLRYHGIDSSAALLDRAREALAHVEATFTLADIVEQPLNDAPDRCDLVVLFGVLHHVPGGDQRAALLRGLASRVAAGGLLAFTEWRFMEDERFRRRVVVWNADIQIEPGDYLLDWRRGEHAIRYCHYVDNAEHARLIAATRLTLVDEYRADAANLYAVLQAQNEPLADFNNITL